MFPISHVSQAAIQGHNLSLWKASIQIYLTLSLEWLMKVPFQLKQKLF